MTERSGLNIGHIPALVWGAPSDSVIVAVHGSMSHKEDTVIRILAEEAAAKGLQTLSIDLPEHGERRDGTLCKPQFCVPELKAVIAHAKRHWREIRLLACSIGAYFSLLAYQDEPVRQAMFLSPVVDMQRLIENMMTWFSVTPERLEAEGEIETPAQTLYWDYYCYVREHPIAKWPVPTGIICGGADNLCEPEITRAFCDRFGCTLTVLPGGEHFFHTDVQLESYRDWLKKLTANAAVI